MPHETESCHRQHARAGDSHGKSTPADGISPPFQPLPDHAQEVATTPSRRTGPRRWMRALEWHLAQGIHPKMNRTTLTIALDLQSRMDYDEGRVRYCLDEMVARLGLSRGAIKKHIAYLREAGFLAWAVHGTKANIRRTLGLGGYAGTATEYAATIPPVYDDAKGHRVIGTGYEARIVVDLRGTQNPPKAAPMVVDNSPVDNPGSGSSEPPSLTPTTFVGQLKMVEGFTTTAERSPKIPTTTPDAPTAQTGSSKATKKRATILGASVTAAGMRLGDKLARAIRSRIPWTRNATHDEIRWVCADMGEQQWTEDQAVGFITEIGHINQGAGYLWQPDRPHRLIAAGLRADQERQAQDEQYRQDLAAAIPYSESTVAREAAQRAADVASLEAMFEISIDDAPEPERTDADRLAAQADWNRWMDVIQHHEEDPNDAMDLYGERFVTYAIRKDCQSKARRKVSYV